MFRKKIFKPNNITLTCIQANCPNKKNYFKYEFKLSLNWLTIKIKMKIVKNKAKRERFIFEIDW